MQTQPSQTVTGRRVYGGDGILPDELIKTNKLTQIQINLLDSIFIFAREIAHGRVQGLEDYKISGPIQYGQRVRPSDFPATDKLLQNFKNFLKVNNSIDLSNEQFEENKNFIVTRLRYNLATAAFGNVAANQVLIENDLQVAKAIDSLPRAQSLALAARKTFVKTSK